MTAWNDATKYMRVCALAWFLYDWALTLPAEIRLYRKQRHWYHPSVACVLLVLARYLGLVALLANFIGFFAHFFPETPDDACHIFFRFMIVTQCLASWASHAVFVVRTSAICKKTSSPKAAFVFLAFCTAILETFSQVYSFWMKYKVGSSNNCLIQYNPARNFGWLYYASSAIFDIIIVIATYRGLQMNHNTALKSGIAPINFNSVLWNSSIIYFIVVTFFNILNLSFYAVYDNSNATILCPIGIAMTSMMSVRVILDMHEYADKRASSFKINGVNLSLASDRAQPPTSSFWALPSQSSIYSSVPNSPLSAHAPRMFPPIKEKLNDADSDDSYPSAAPPYSPILDRRGSDKRTNTINRRPLSASTGASGLTGASGTSSLTIAVPSSPATPSGIMVSRTVEVFEHPEPWETSEWGQRESLPAPPPVVCHAV